MDEQKNFFNILADELSRRDNPTDLKSAILAKVEEISPLIIVSYADGKIMLTENEELIISEFFRLRCNIDSGGALSSSVPSDTDSAESVTETHSYTGAPCNMPNAISDLASAILSVRDELLALKCNLAVGDYVLIASLEQKDRYVLIDKVLNTTED